MRAELKERKGLNRRGVAPTFWSAALFLQMLLWTASSVEHHHWGHAIGRGGMALFALVNYAVWLRHALDRS